MIIRGPRPTSNFYLLNKAISEDQRLSWPARGLLIYLLGKPDHWQVSVQALVNETQASAKPMGRDGVLSLLRELIAAGYCTRRQVRKEDGTMGEKKYVIFEEPTFQPGTSEPGTSEPGTAEPDTAEPDTAEPDTAEPDTAEPDTAEPDTAEPDTAEPDTAEPDTAEPDTANPPLVSIDLKKGLIGKEGLNIPAAPAALPADVEILPATRKKAAQPAQDLTRKETALQAACQATWTAYCGAYRARYGVEPTRNASVNSKVKQFVIRIGQDESPGVARFFVERVSDAFVVRGYHSVGVLLQNAEAYRTQWATGQAMTSTRAQQADKTQSNFDAVSEAMAIRRAKQQGNQNAQ